MKRKEVRLEMRFNISTSNHPPPPPCHADSGAIEPNPEFEIDKISEYVDISNWCHHIPYILPQGRTVWWNPVQKADDEFEEEEEEEEDEKENPDEPEPEDGPPLLTSVSEDDSELLFPPMRTLRMLCVTCRGRWYACMDM